MYLLSVGEETDTGNVVFLKDTTLGKIVINRLPSKGIYTYMGRFFHGEIIEQSALNEARENATHCVIKNNYTEFWRED